MERKELCIISDSDIPARFWCDQRRRLIHTDMRHSTHYHRDITTITHPIARQMAEECTNVTAEMGLQCIK